MKLGYGGTKEEMQRLLEDAEKLTGVKYDINNLGDVYNAIHEIQKNLKITGTTAEEAKTTFSGSFGMMKAAAMDLMGYLGAEEMYSFVPQALENLATSVDIFFFGNFLPMVGRIVEQIPSVLSQGLGLLTDRLNNAGSLATSGFITGFIQGIPGLIQATAEFVAAVVNYIINHKDEFFQIAHECVAALVNGLGEVIPLSEETMKNLPGVIEKALQAVALLKVGSILQPFVSQFGGVIGGAFKGAWSQASTFFGLMKSGGGMFSNLGLMISQGTGPLANLAASFVNAGGGLSGFMALLKGFGSALISAIASPVALITAAIATLVAGFMHLWNTNENFKNGILETWNGLVAKFNEFTQGILDRINAFGFDFQSVGEFCSAVWDGFCNLLAPVFRGVWDMIASILSGAMDVITGLLDIFIGLFSGNWDQAWTGVKEVFGAIWDTCVELFTSFGSTLVNLGNEILGFFGTDWNGLWQGIKDFFEQIWTGICDFFKNSLQSIQDFMVSAGEAISKWWNETWQAISDFFSSTWETIKQTASDAVNACSTAISNAWTAVKNKTSEIWNNIKSSIENVVTNIRNKISEGWNWISTTTSNIFNNVKNTVSTIWNNIKTAITQSIQNAKDTVSSTINNMKNAVSQTFDNIKQAASDKFRQVKEAITKPIDDAKRLISQAIDRIKGIFRGANFSFPKIKLPHFSIVGSFSLTPPRVPHLSIDWYAKAMEKGMILTSPTIFGMDGGKLLGGGEAGPEAVVGVNSLQGMITKAVRQSNASDPIDYERMASIIREAIETITLETIINMDSRAVAKAIGKPMDQELARLRMAR